MVKTVASLQQLGLQELTISVGLPIQESDNAVPPSGKNKAVIAEQSPKKKKSENVQPSTKKIKEEEIPVRPSSSDKANSQSAKGSDKTVQSSSRKKQQDSSKVPSSDKEKAVNGLQSPRDIDGKKKTDDTVKRSSTEKNSENTVQALQSKTKKNNDVTVKTSSDPGKKSSDNNEKKLQDTLQPPSLKKAPSSGNQASSKKNPDSGQERSNTPSSGKKSDNNEKKSQDALQPPSLKKAHSSSSQSSEKKDSESRQERSNTPSSGKKSNNEKNLQDTLQPPPLKKVPSSSSQASSEKKGLVSGQERSNTPSSTRTSDKQGSDSISRTASSDKKAANSAPPSPSTKKIQKAVLPSSGKTTSGNENQSDGFQTSGKASSKVVEPSSSKTRSDNAQHSPNTKVPKIVEPSSDKISVANTPKHEKKRSEHVVKQSASKKNADNVVDPSPSKSEKVDQLLSRDKRLDKKVNSDTAIQRSVSGEKEKNKKTPDIIAQSADLNTAVQPNHQVSGEKKKKSDNVPQSPSGEKKAGGEINAAPNKKAKDTGAQPSSSSEKTSGKKAPPSPSSAKTETPILIQSSSSGKASGHAFEISSINSKPDNVEAFSRSKREGNAAKPSSVNKASDTKAHLSSGEKGSDNIGKPASSGVKKDVDNAVRLSSTEKKFVKKENFDSTSQTLFPPVFLKQIESSEMLSTSMGQPRKLIKRHKSLELKPDALAIRANSKPLLRSGGSKMIISFRNSQAISASYISARLSMVQILSKGLCFLKLDIQSIRSPHTRIDAMNISWQFSRSMRNFKSTSPIVKAVAPKQSIGARDEETRQSKFGLEVPIQASPMGVNVGPKFSADLTSDRKVERGMFITGFIQGDDDAAGWRIKENTGAMSGVPSHFCIGVVIQYSGVIAMELELHATRQMEFMRFSLLSQPLHSSMALELDVDSLQHDFEPENPPETWREWFPKINGDVEGYNLTHSQPALTS